jgi:hypothetical protein
MREETEDEERRTLDWFVDQPRLLAFDIGCELQRHRRFVDSTCAERQHGFWGLRLRYNFNPAVLWSAVFRIKKVCKGMYGAESMMRKAGLIQGSRIPRGGDKSNHTSLSRLSSPLLSSLLFSSHVAGVSSPHIHKLSRSHKLISPHPDDGCS